MFKLLDNHKETLKCQYLSCDPLKPETTIMKGNKYTLISTINKNINKVPLKQLHECYAFRGLEALKC